MLDPRKLNHIAGLHTNPLNYPLSWDSGGEQYVHLAWHNRTIAITNVPLLLNVPIALPATYQDQRMIAQRSCFTIHGIELKPLQTILKDNGVELNDCLFEYSIDSEARETLLKDLYMLGVSASTIFPDLDNLAKDLRFDVGDF